MPAALGIESAESGMDTHRRDIALQNLAAGIARRRLTAPARILLDLIAPLGFLASQLALFVRPFAPFGQWRDYLMALEEEAGWQKLQSLVGDQYDSNTDV